VAHPHRRGHRRRLGEGRRRRREAGPSLVPVPSRPRVRFDAVPRVLLRPWFVGYDMTPYVTEHAVCRHPVTLSASCPLITPSRCAVAIRVQLQPRAVAVC